MQSQDGTWYDMMKNAVRNGGSIGPWYVQDTCLPDNKGKMLQKLAVSHLACRFYDGLAYAWI